MDRIVKAMDRLIQVLKHRTQHHDPDVRQISLALIEHLRLFPSGWVAQAIQSPQMSVYNNYLEKALVLEKTVIHHFLQNFWLASIVQNAPTSDNLVQIREKYRQVTRSGWLQLIMNIAPTESSLILGKPIQTNRVPRYNNLFRQVIVPLYGHNPKSKLTVLDAGSSSGIGAHAAHIHNLPIKKWIGVDKEDHRANLPWILTCSTRLGEITSNQFSENLKLIFSLPKNTQILRGDIENLPQSIAPESVDLYLAIFSYYQLHNPIQAYNEALRIIKTGGFLIITDYLIKSGQRSFHLTSPNHKSRLLTLALRKNSPQDVELVTIHHWQDPDLTQGKTAKIPKKLTLNNIPLQNSRQ